MREWWHRRTIKEGVAVCLAVLAYVGAVRAFGQCGTHDFGFVGDILCEAQDLALVIIGAVLGAMLGVDLQRHEDKKRKDGAQPGKDGTPGPGADADHASGKP